MGHGSFGTVYQAEWRGVQVAAKVIRTAGIRDIDEGKLLQEVTIMKALRHPNLLLFMCYLKSDTSLTIVSEYMPGGSLLDVLSDRATPMPVGTKLGILGDVAAGMAYLHGSNPPIIHRDLKSSNVLLSASMQAKVCDFGLTVIAHKHGSAAEHRDDSVLGSLLWSAPEVVGQGLFSTKSDVYAFGVMVWETVMRELPYSDTNPVLVATRVVEGHRPQVGPEFDSVQPLRLLMEECWHQAPAARPEFAEIITRLEHARELLKDVILSSTMDVKVSDFGLAAIKTANKTSTLCGAIAWMAPEVISNGEYSEASDVYSFGVVMHEILSCELPFKGLDQSLGPVAAARFSQFPVVAVIGGDSSRVCMSLLDGNATHPGLTPSRIPVISPQSSSPLLSDKTKYPSFMRVVSPDSLTSLGMVQLLSMAEWRGVQVAAKVIRTAGIVDIDEGKLLQEVTIMKALRHPNLLLFMCYLKSDTSLTIVSEYMPGGSLLDVLSDRATPMPVGTKLGILGDVAAGMAYLHGSNPPIIHRDLKSSNVLLSASMQAKVCDFGLTVIAHKHGSAAEHRDDSVLGSLLWSAPEVVDQGLFSTKSDVYAFGVMVWETVMRELPYSDTNPVLVATRVVEGHRPQVGPEFDSVQPLRLLMEECWHQAPVARPEFAEITLRLNKSRELLNDVIKSTEEATHDRHIQQSTELWEWNPRVMKQALYQHHAVMRAALHSHKGYEVKTQGDAFMIAFQSTVDALHFCVDAQRSLVHLNWNPELLEFPSPFLQLSSKMDVKVSDFGLAAVKTANKTSTLCGAIAWMAPEVISNGQYSGASDVYSFGIVMHEILSCELPFKGLDQVAVVQEIMDGRRPVIPKKLGTYSAEYIHLMCSCWSQEPSKRPPFKRISERLAAI
eukprot:m51a1_g1982 putative pas domain-containing protein tyrosine kinase (893) ;mRNA; r:1127166-1135773